MKAHQDKAWFCGRCGLPYRSKEVAESCCVCVECAGRTAYSGHHKLCERCGLRKTIEHNVKHQLDLERTLKLQRTRLFVLDAAAQATPEDRKLIAGINKRILKQNKKKR